jgi:hypothetical protein
MTEPTAESPSPSPNPNPSPSPSPNGSPNPNPLLSQPQFQSPPASPPASPSPRAAAGDRSRRLGATAGRRGRATLADDPSLPRPGGASPGDADERELPPVRETLQGLSDAGKHGASLVRKAGEKDWTEFLTALFGFASMLFVWWLVAGTGKTKTERQTYELTEDEAENLAAPAAAILARSWVNARYGKHILGGADWILLALTLSEYTERVSPLIRERIARSRVPFPRRPRPSTGDSRAPGRPAGRPAPAPERDQEVDDGLVASPTVPWQPYSHVRGVGLT